MQIWDWILPHWGLCIKMNYCMFYYFIFSDSYSLGHTSVMKTVLQQWVSIPISQFTCTYQLLTTHVLRPQYNQSGPIMLPPMVWQLDQIFNYCGCWSVMSTVFTILYYFVVFKVLIKVLCWPAYMHSKY